MAALMLWLLYRKTNVDQLELGVSMGLGESGKIAFAHKSHDTAKDRCQNKFKLGWGSIHHWQHDRVSGFRSNEDRKHTLQQFLEIGLIILLLQASEVQLQTRVYPMCFKQEARKQKATLAVLTANSEDVAVAANKHSPWLLGLSRSLGGGASVHFEHADPDQDRRKVNQLSSIESGFLNEISNCNSIVKRGVNTPRFFMYYKSPRLNCNQ